jgi:hypothetical protein
LGDIQPIFILQTRDDFFVLEIRFFKHGSVGIASSKDAI